MRARNLSSLAVVCVAVLCCLGTKRDYAKPTTEELMARIPANPTPHCKSDQGLPDATCTPGSVITKSKDDICNNVSTSSIRPISEYTDKLKVAQIVEYGWHDNDPSDYEEDHLISLEIGGNPDDTANLWPEPHSGVYGSLVKDKVENWLHKQICDGSMTPEEAQQGIASDWRQYIEKAVPQTPHKRVMEVQ